MKIIFAGSFVMMAIVLPALAAAQTYYPSPSQALGQSIASDTPSSPITPGTVTITATPTSTTPTVPPASDQGSGQNFLNANGITVNSNSDPVTITMPRAAFINLLQQIDSLLVQLNAKLSGTNTGM